MSAQYVSYLLVETSDATDMQRCYRVQDDAVFSPSLVVVPTGIEKAAEGKVAQSEGGLRLFALVIAIDNYVNEDIPDLSGCTNDAKDFTTFLTDNLCVPAQRICRLSNEGATREAILGNFRTHFINNADIQKGDAIVFFYAGHGSRVEADPAWFADGNMVETIVPHDEGSKDSDGNVIYGIPDRTFDGLMRELAFKKGDNIASLLAASRL